MALALRLKRECVVEIDQRPYEFARQLPDGQMAFDDLETARRRVYDERRFVEMYLADRIVVLDWGRLPTKYREAADRALETLPDKFSAEARRRHAYCVAYDMAEPRPRKTQEGLRELVAAVAEQEEDPHPPDWRTLCTWLRTRGTEGRRRLAAMRSYDDKKGRKKGLDEAVERIIEEETEQVYLKEKKSPGSVYESVVFRIIQRNEELTGEADAASAPLGCGLAFPSESTVRRRVGETPYYQAEKRRRGRRAADRALKPVRTAPQDDAPLQTMIIDHTKIDGWMFFDGKTNMPCGGRPWLTMALDAYSRYPLGYYVGFEPPSTYSVMMCLRNAIMPKQALLARHPGMLLEWPGAGLPRRLVCDNGKELVGLSLPRACAELGIELQATPVRQPHYKGIAERFFGTLNTRFVHKLPGTTFGNPKKLKDEEIDPRKEMKISFDDFERLLTLWLVKDYARTRNRNIGVAPERRWKDGIERVGMELPARFGDMAVALSRFDSRVLSRHGVRYKNLEYRDDAVVRKVLGAARADRADVEIKYDPTDLSQIYVLYKPIGEYLGPLTCTRAEYARGLSLWQHETIEEETRKRERDPKAFIDLMRTRGELVAETRLAIRTGRAKAFHARMEGIGSHRPLVQATVSADGEVVVDREALVALPEPMDPRGKDASIKAEDAAQADPALVAGAEPPSADEDEELERLLATQNYQIRQATRSVENG